MLFEQVSPFTFSVPRPGVFGPGSGCRDPPGTGLGPVWPGVILWHRPPSPCPPWSLVWSHTAWAPTTAPGGRVPDTLLLAPVPVASGRPHAPKAEEGTCRALQGRSKCSAPGRDSLTPSLPWGMSALCFGLLHPLSHPAREVAVAQVESFSMLASLQPRHQFGDLTRVTQRGSTSPTPALEAESCVFPNSSWGFQCWPSPCLGRPALSQQQAQALITLWFLSLLFKNKTQQKRGRRRVLTASLRSPCVSLHVAQAGRSWQGTWGARHLGASPCISCL